MATKQTLDVSICLRNDTAAMWSAINPKLLKGEIGIEIDTNKIKIGDGVSNWNSLEYASAKPAVLNTTDPTQADSNYDIGTLYINTTTQKIFILMQVSSGTAIWKRIVTSEELSTLGYGDMLVSDYAATAQTQGKTGYVDKALVADELTNPVGIEDVVGAGTAASKNVGTAIGQVVVVGSDGKIDSSLIPSLAITDVYEADSQSTMLALSNAEKGDICVRTDENKSYILGGTGVYSVLDNWKVLRTPTDVILSVNGKIGVVTLNTDDISEGSDNLYYTNARFDSRFSQSFPESYTNSFSQSQSTDLSDGSNLMRYTDSIIFNCGNAGYNQSVQITATSTNLTYPNTLTLSATSTINNDTIIWSVENNQYIQVAGGVVSFKKQPVSSADYVITAKSSVSQLIYDTVVIHVIVSE